VRTVATRTRGIMRNGTRFTSSAAWI
jgi:hypothetical protein